jgi:hypothetical protein
LKFVTVHPKKSNELSRDLVGIASTHVAHSTPEQYAVNVEDQDRAFNAARHGAPFYLSHYRCAWPDCRVYGHRMLSVHRQGPLKSNSHKPGRNFVVADDTSDFLFKGVPLIDEGFHVRLVAVALQILRERNESSPNRRFISLVIM